MRVDHLLPLAHFGLWTSRADLVDFFIYFNFFFTIPQTSEFDFCECQLIVYF